MQKITYVWIFLIMGFVLLGITAIEFQGITFVYASVIAFVMSLYYVRREDKVDIQEAKSENS